MSKPAWIAACLACAVGLAGEAVAAPTSALTVSGQVVSPGTYDADALHALPAATQTVTYAAGGSPVTDTFTGPTLWGLLQSAGGVAVDPSVKNDVLRSYVVATGSDGYQAAISAGEISPKFGAKPDLVADADTAGRLPAPDGFARVVAAGDKAGGRYVSNLTDLHVAIAPSQPGTGGGTTSRFSVGGAVAAPLSFDLAALQGLTAHTETTTYTAGAASVTDTYKGALLWDVLGRAGVLTAPSIKNDILRKVVSVTGSDGYQVDLSLGEIDPLFGDEQVLVAYSDTGGQLAGGDGFARLIVPGDLAGGRYVSNLASLTVFDASVPEPVAGAPLLAGAALLAIVGRRARRR